MSIGFVASISDYKRVKKTNRGPALGSYLIDMKKQFQNKKGLNLPLQSAMEEFIND